MCQTVNTDGGIMLPQLCENEYFVLVHLSCEAAYSRLSVIDEQQRKHIWFRFNLYFSTLEGNDTFITRLNCTKQHFSSPRMMLARYRSGKASFI